MKPLQVTYQKIDGTLTSTPDSNIAKAFMKYVWGDQFAFMLEDMQRYPATRIFEMMSPWLRRQNTGMWIIGTLSSSGDSKLIAALEHFAQTAPQSSPFLYQFYESSAPDTMPANPVFTKLRTQYTNMKACSNALKKTTTLSSTKDLESTFTMTKSLIDNIPKTIPVGKSQIGQKELATLVSVSSISLSQIQTAWLAAQAVNEQLKAYMGDTITFYLRSGASASVDAAYIKSMVATLQTNIQNAIAALQNLAAAQNPTDVLFSTTQTVTDACVQAITNVGTEADRLTKTWGDQAAGISTDLGHIQNIQFKLRLFPANVGIGYPGLQFDTTIVSGSHILQVSKPRSLFTVNLQNCLAFNTLDTQWLDLYATFFEHWVSVKKNPLITLQIGEYTLRDCLLVAPPSFVNRLEITELFPLQFLSQSTNIDDLKPLFEA